MDAVTAINKTSILFYKTTGPTNRVFLQNDSNHLKKNIMNPNKTGFN